MDEQDRRQLFECLGEIQAAHDLLQGQIEAGQRALVALLRSVDPASPLAADVRAHMQEWLSLSKDPDAGSPPATVSGFEMAQRVFLEALQPPKPSTAH